MIKDHYIPLLDYAARERLTIIEVYRLIDNNQVQYLKKKNKYHIKVDSL